MPTAIDRTMIRSETIPGADERGNPCRTTITLRVNPAWTADNDEWFYLCTAVETDSNGKAETLDEATFDEVEDAVSWVEAVAQETEERYAAIEDDYREALAESLAIMAGDEARPGSPEAELLALVARTVKAGKVAQLLARLK